MDSWLWKTFLPHVLQWLPEDKSNRLWWIYKAIINGWFVKYALGIQIANTIFFYNVNQITKNKTVPL